MGKKEITLNEYQQKAYASCMSSCDNPCYMMNNLIAKVGEFIGKMAKGIKDGEYIFNKNRIEYKKECDIAKLYRRVDEEKDLQKKLGEVLWHLSCICTVFGWSFEEIAKQNLMEHEMIQVDKSEQK